MSVHDQVPVQSGFHGKSTGAEVLADIGLAGRTAVVTGGYGGIGLGWLGADGEPSELAGQGFKTPRQGCSTTLWAASSPLRDGKSGVCCEDCNIAAPTVEGSPTARYFGVDAHTCDDQAEPLWDLSERLLAAA